MIEVKNLTHVYNEGLPHETTALDDISFRIEDGSFVGIIGHTGSGKSTLLQHLNGLLKPSSGTIVIDGVDITDSHTKMLDIRRKVGLVFQYPEYQLFEETVAKDVAFGPSNLGLGQKEIDERVRRSIEMVGLDYNHVKDISPFELSGGQKRRVAIAGVLAMEPEVLVLDEPTAMLDPVGRREVLETVHRLNRERGMTVILITHYMEEAVGADRVVVIDDGSVRMDGTPREIFSQVEELRALQLDVPQPTALAFALRKAGYPLPHDILTEAECANAIAALLQKGVSA